MPDSPSLIEAIIGLRSDVKHLSSDVNKLSSKLESLPTMRDLNNVEDRVERLEANQTKMVTGIASGWLAGISFLFTYLFRGHGS